MKARLLVLRATLWLRCASTNITALQVVRPVLLVLKLAFLDRMQVFMTCYQSPQMMRMICWTWHMVSPKRAPCARFILYWLCFCH